MFGKIEPVKTIALIVKGRFEHSSILLLSAVSKAHLDGANLSGANLTGAVISEEQLKEAKSLEGTTMPDGKIHP